MPNDNAMTFGKLLDRLIWESGDSRAKFAADFGLTDATAHRLVKDASSPSLNRVIDIAERFERKVVILPKGFDLPEEAVVLQHAETDAERKKKE